MSSSGLTLLLTVSFVLFARVTSYVPPWMANEYKFRCLQVCAEYLKGETYSCFSAGGYGLAAGVLIVRILPNFEWRYYGIHEAQYRHDICKHVLVADEYYTKGNKTVCNPAYFRPGIYNDKGTRSSGATSPTDVKKLVRYLGNITRFAQEIQKEVMIVDERSSKRAAANQTTDNKGDITQETKNHIFPLIGKIINSILGVVGLAKGQAQRSNSVEDFSNIMMTPPPIQDTQNIELQNLRRNYYGKKEDHRSATDDPRSDAICYWVSKDMCQSRRMVVCIHDVCCWATLNTNQCNQIMNYNGINIYRHNIHSIVHTVFN